MMDENKKQQLHEIAINSIIHGLNTGKPLSLNLDDYDDDLRIKQATFVTLHKQDQLRGCIGTLEPHRPLAEDIAHNAFAAAFSDYRFSAVTTDEVDQLDVHISILATPEDIEFSSEEDLIEQLRPGIDGLILEENNHRGTFLPSVWDSVTDKRDFLNHLKQKSGLASNYWSNTIRIQRYTVEEF